MKFKALFLALVILVGGGCLDDKVPPGRILIKNDSLDRSFNVISVVGGGQYSILKPGERTLLPAGTRTFTAKRQYESYTRRYVVACPAITGAGVVIKMIDMHTNRMPAGCQTVSATKE
jgi:hypothetical protein